VVLAAAFAIALPASTIAVTGYNTPSSPYVSSTVTGVTFKALINSGEQPFGADVFEGIPDGIGVVPGPGPNPKYVDLYVTHEQSHVPFGLTPTTVYADYQDSSVSRVRVDLATKSITELDESALPASAGFIRFCSAFMAGPEQGFPRYTFLVNEESNDILPVPAGAPYSSDPSADPKRQAGYSAYLDTLTGHYGILAGAGRHNHENQVVVPGWKSGIVSLSGDDTFTSTSSPTRPNLSQLYMYSAKNATKFLKDDGTLMAFRVTATDAGPVDAADPLNNANDFFEITSGDTWSGEFIPVPPDVARGTTSDLPQDALEDWSNAHNVFQFIRVEDIAYDPDSPRVVYFADTGNSRLLEDSNGHLYRAPSGTAGTLASAGRIFKMVLNASDPTKVDEFSVVVDASTLGMRNPDNVAISHNSLMVQEDTSNAKIWMQSLSSGDWTLLASAVQPEAETSGITDVSRWFGAGWWALDVQSHVNESLIDVYHTWSDGPIPPGGDQYRFHREDGQLLLMYVPES
jgi:hypothetical protein